MGIFKIFFFDPKFARYVLFKPHKTPKLVRFGKIEHNIHPAHGGTKHSTGDEMDRSG